MLGGKQQREEHDLSRTPVCMDRDGTVDDLSDRVFRLPFPLISGTTGVAHGYGSSWPVSRRAFRRAWLTNAFATGGASRASSGLATLYFSYLCATRNRTLKLVYG
jgi:hypothetical protein